MLFRIETKVWAGLAGLMTGGAFGSFVVWLLGALVLGAPHDAAHAQAAPWRVDALVPLLLDALLGGGAAYQAPPSNHAGNAATGIPMDDTAAGHDIDDHVAEDQSAEIMPTLLGNEIDPLP